MKITEILTNEEIIFIKKLCVRYNRDFILIDEIKYKVPIEVWKKASIEEWRKELDKQVI